MCRICGRTLKCIFDAMPSRTEVCKRSFSTAQRSMQSSSRVVLPFSPRIAIRSALNVDSRPTLGSSTFLLPFRSKFHATSARSESVVSSESPISQAELPPSILAPEATSADTSASPTANSTPLVLTKSIQQLLPILSAQKPHYITAHLHRFPYLLTEGDTLRLPFHMHGVEPGDILRLNRASLLGSREYTLKAGTTHTETYDGNRTGQPQYLDERLFECRVRVLGVESSPMTVKEKTKRRNRKVKHAKSKHKYTVLKVMEITVKTLEELTAEKGELLLSSDD